MARVSGDRDEVKVVSLGSIGDVKERFVSRSERVL